MGFLLEGIMAVTWQQAIMYVMGTILIWLAVKKEYESSLFLPLGFGTILVNLPYSDMTDQMVQRKISAVEITERLFKTGIETSEAIPILLFTGIGVMISLGPLLSQPALFLFGAAVQFRISATILIACLMKFGLRDAALVGIIRAVDRFTSILVSRVLGSGYIGPIAVTIHFCMVLVPIIQPFAIWLVTTKRERRTHMEYNPKGVNKQLRITFPITVTIIVGLISPQPVALVGLLMFRNLLRECDVLGSLSQTAQSEFANVITPLPGITISFSMRAEQFVNSATLTVMVLDLVVFVFDTVGGVLFAKLINVLLEMTGRKPVNSMVGGCGISAFPMSSRVVQKMAAREEPDNIILIQVAGTNILGQVASAITGGLVISIVFQYLQGGGNEVSNRLWGRQQRRRRVNMGRVGTTLKVTEKGIGGVFAAIIIITATVMVLGQITRGHRDGREQLSGRGEQTGRLGVFPLNLSMFPAVGKSGKY